MNSEAIKVWKLNKWKGERKRWESQKTLQTTFERPFQGFFRKCYSMQ